MNIANLADLHLNCSQYGEDNTTGRSWRADDFKFACAKTVDHIIENNKPDMVFIIGDSFDHPLPDNRSRGFFSAQIEKLVRAGAEVHILVGNHESNSSGHALLDLEELKKPNTFIYYSAQVFEKNGVLFLIYPQTSEVEAKIKSMRGAYLDFINENRKRISEAKKKGLPVVLYAHTGIIGAYMNDGAVNKGADGITVEDLSLSDADWIFLGDYHGHQKLKVKGAKGAYYIGSLERTNIKDLSSTKGYMVYDTEKDKATFVSTNEFVRPMIDIEDGIDLVKKADLLKEGARGAIIRLSYKGTKKDFESVHQQLLDIKRDLEKNYGAKHVYTKTEAHDQDQEEKANKIVEEIEKMGCSIEEKDIENIVRINVEKSDYDEAEQKALMELASDVISTVNKKNRNGDEK
jgi:DNA repair exonuclease SbcCD nuclease subunit